MKLTDVMTSNGWISYPTDDKYKKLKVYQKDSFLLGVQKIGNVFRVDIQQCIPFGAELMPIQKVLDNQIVPRDSLESTLNQLLPQLANMPSE